VNITLILRVVPTLVSWWLWKSRPISLRLPITPVWRRELNISRYSIGRSIEARGYFPTLRLDIGLFTDVLLVESRVFSYLPLLKANTVTVWTCLESINYIVGA
jgi:hypothetical protein